jgi:hypothetical protein
MDPIMKFTPNSTHCTTCHTENPEVNEDEETTCCLDTVCEVNDLGRCARCNPLCDLCGFEILGGFEIENRRVIHPDRLCPSAKVEKPKKAPRERVSAERKLAEKAGVVQPETRRQSGSHADCTHEPTKSARAACRRKRAADAGK